VNDLKQGVEVFLHKPELRAFRKAMEKEFIKRMEEEANRHNIATVQVLLKQTGFDPGPLMVSVATAPTPLPPSLPGPFGYRLIRHFGRH
jgi:hypothetical protein